MKGHFKGKRAKKTLDAKSDDKENGIKEVIYK